MFLLLDRFIYETEHFNGVSELLEILGRYGKIYSNYITETKKEMLISL